MPDATGLLCERDGCGHSEFAHRWRGAEYLRGACYVRGCACAAMLGPQTHLVGLFD